jgi:NAD(P)H-nitrite reductase large subunit
MATRHVIVGGGTAGLNAILTIRECEGVASAIDLVSAERPYSRMVLPYYLGGGIAESHVFTLTPPRLAQLKVRPHLGRRAAALDPAAHRLTLDDGTILEYDRLLVATGSSPVKAPVPGADLPGVHSFWTLEQARGVASQLREGSRVAVVGAGFIAFTMLNALLSRKVRLSVVEVAPQILPRMVDRAGAEIVERWLTRRGVDIRTGATLIGIEEAGGRKRLRFREGNDLDADAVIMATGIRTNLEWLAGSGLTVNRGILVDDHLRASEPHVFAAGDVAEGRDLVTGLPALHAIEPTAMEHGRVAGANMAGQDVAYRGSLLMNIVEVCDLDIASFGAWDDPEAEAFAAARPARFAYRKLLWRGDRLVGATILGRANDIWTTNDIGMLKGLVQARVPLGQWKAHLGRNPFDVKPVYVAAGITARLLPETTLSPSVPVERLG